MVLSNCIIPPSQNFLAIIVQLQGDGSSHNKWPPAWRICGAGFVVGESMKAVREVFEEGAKIKNIILWFNWPCDMMIGFTAILNEIKVDGEEFVKDWFTKRSTSYTTNP